MMGPGAQYDSHSVSRISEVSKSKESSEYEKHTKKMSGVIQKFDDYDNPIMPRHFPKKSSDTEGSIALFDLSSSINFQIGYKHRSYHSEDIRQLRDVNEEEDEGVEGQVIDGAQYEYEDQNAPEYLQDYSGEQNEQEDDEEVDEAEADYLEQQAILRMKQQQEDENQDENDEEDPRGNEAHEMGEREGLTTEEDGFSEQIMDEIRNEEEGLGDAEYYDQDPINYQKMNVKGLHRPQEEEYQQEDEEGQEQAEEEYDDGVSGQEDLHQAEESGQESEYQGEDENEHRQYAHQYYQQYEGQDPYGQMEEMDVIQEDEEEAIRQMEMERAQAIESGQMIEEVVEEEHETNEESQDQQAKYNHKKARTGIL